jgi:hypothetical protein
MTHPTIDQIVTASFSATNQSEEFANFAAIDLPRAEWDWMSQLVASASHSVWMGMSVTYDFADHPVFRLARKRALRSYYRLLFKANPTPEEARAIRSLTSGPYGNSLPSRVIRIGKVWIRQHQFIAAVALFAFLAAAIVCLRRITDPGAIRLLQAVWRTCTLGSTLLVLEFSWGKRNRRIAWHA